MCLCRPRPIRVHPCLRFALGSESAILQISQATSCVVRHSRMRTRLLHPDLPDRRDVRYALNRCRNWCAFRRFMSCRKSTSSIRRALLDFRFSVRHITIVGSHWQSPGLPKAFRPSTASARSPGRGLLAKCLISISLSSGDGTGFRAFDNRPVSCRAAKRCLAPKGDETCLVLRS
jgi:hypothetical protein